MKKQENDPEVPEDLGVVIESKKVKFWLDIKENTEKRIESLHQTLEVENLLLESLKTRIEAIRKEEEGK